MRAKGEGSIHHRKSDQRWEARLDLGYINGKRKFRAFYGKTRKEALANLAKARDEAKQGIITLPARYTVADLLNQWLKETASHRKSTTQAVYTNEVHRNLLPHLERIKLSDFSSLHVEQLQHLLEQRGLSGRSVLKARTILSSAMGWATRHKLISSNPVLLATSPRLQPIEKRSLSVTEARLFIKTISGNRFEALYLVMLTLGIRRGEVLGLMWSDIDWDTGQVTIRRQLQRMQDRSGLKLLEPKYASRRVLYLPPFALAKLREHQQKQDDERSIAGEQWQQTDLVFPNTYGSPMEPSGLQRSFGRLRKKIGLPDLTLHGLRHSATSIYLTMGIQPHIVQSIMGHADPNTTLAVYAHTQDDDRRKAATLMESTLLSNSS